MQKEHLWVGRSKGATPAGGRRAIKGAAPTSAVPHVFPFWPTSKCYGRLRYKTYDENLRHQHHGGRNSTT